MTRAIVRQFGSPAEVVMTESTDDHQALSAGQVRVRMLLASINPSDLVTISGAYRSRTTLPFVPGFEGVGIVESIGEDVSTLRVGQRVLPIGSVGAWQDVKVAEQRWCFPVPEDLSNEQAATAYINPLTAWLMVEQFAPTRPGEMVVVNAATSAIGQMIIRMLNRKGLRPIAIIRRADAAMELDGLDIEAVLDSSEGDIQSRVQEVSGGRGLTVACDAVGGPEGDSLARALSPGGTLVHYGLLSGVPLSYRLYSERPDVRIILFHLREWVHAASPVEIQSAFDEVFGLIRDGTAASRVAHVFPLTDIRRALATEARPKRQGKVFVTTRYAG
ncbi:hypothetical protein COL154_012685 [Colletotrichum chrysophilum]|uniref:uncharacterized protein n=1 Tax=Colletotrichum chrysophilum TaxID=1836956 RepID=UPI002301352A|nr:uncharacterized protein COL26b_013243 [Colletotrichum chrysophilum]KAJ0338531.1 hypothetical protein KNSL1_012392 [Colletotrichum chrysophilum]KAJ0352082.1 hypothetical protein COL154_012685 [Colletotrichum chrysophilum]KAJ0362700.1 hypothetical protein COL26b_013243 [Colletotrichum chrysophilum]